MSNADPTNPYGLDPQTAAMLQMILGSSVMGAGITPNLSMGQYNALAGLVPQDPDTLDFNRDAMNYFQDVLQTGADPMALAFGPGMDQFAPNAFDPLISQTVPDSPALVQFNQYLTQGSSLPGLIANRIIDGRDPSEIISDLQSNFGFDTPDFNDPSINVLRPYLLYDTDIGGGGTGGPVGIDWGKVQDEVTRVADLYSQIPRAGESSPVYDADGNLVDAGGDTTFDIVDTGQVDALGNPVRQVSVMTTTSTPSKMAEEFNRLGLPLPTEEFTSEYILGPNQVAMEQAVGQASDVERAAMDEYLAAGQQRREGWQGGQVWQPPARTATAQDQQAGINYLGTTDQGLVGSTPGITERSTDVQGPRYQNDPYVYIPGYEGETNANSLLSGEQIGSIIGGTGTGEITVDDVTHLANPDTYMEWYNAHGNELNDAQRYDVIMHAIDMGDAFGDTPQGRQWRQIFSDIRDDLGETAQGGGEAGLIENVGNALDSSVSEDLASQARDITDPTEFTNFITAHATELGSDGLQSLTANAQANAQYETGTAIGDQWSDIANSLLRGEVPGGGGGPQGLRQPGKLGISQEALDALLPRRKPAPTGDQPQPPEPGQGQLVDQLIANGVLPQPPSPTDYSGAVMEAQPQLGQPTRPGGYPSTTDADVQTAYNRQLLQQWLQNNEPDPMLSATDQLQRDATRASGPPMSEGAPTGVEFMDPGYYSYWGRDPNSIMPYLYGVQTSYVGPGTTRQEWLYNTGQAIPRVHGPGGWNPFDTPRPQNVPPSETVGSSPQDLAMLQQWLGGAPSQAERTDELGNQEQNPDYTQPTPPYVYGGTYNGPPPTYPQYQFPQGATGQRADWTQQYQFPQGATGERVRGGAADQFYENIVNILGGGQQPQQAQGQPPRQGQGPPGPGDQLPPGETWQDIFNASTQNTQASFDMESDRAQMREVMLRHLRQQQEAADAQTETDRIANRGAPHYRQSDEARASILGGYRGEDRTGVPRYYRDAQQRWRQAWLAKQQLMHQTYGAEEGAARGLAWNLRNQGVTPLSMTMYARMLPMQGAGIQRG